LATGSSWSTIATIGIALMGIGDALGMSKGMVAGAIISGAYFGDKMSPLSDTTNLAPAMAGTDLFTHIRYMMHTTIPTYVITLILFLILGFTVETGANAANVSDVLAAIDGSFHITPVLFLVPAAVVFMIVKKVPALPALLVGSLLGGLLAVILQPETVAKLSGVEGDYLKSSYMGVMKSMYGDVHIETSNKAVSELLTSKGMAGMMNTIWLILCAMVFGGVMEVSGLLVKLTQSVIRFVHSTGSLVFATAATCVVFNATASDQYISIVVPGRMYADTYRKRGLSPEVLSRSLEDSGTVTSVLIPWNTCGATQAGILGVATGTYAMYCFFNIISPIMTVLFAYLNIKIRRLEDEPKD
jgi:NhaC family Na+:H+ antiporter